MNQENGMMVVSPLPVTPYDFPALKSEEEIAAKYIRGSKLVGSIFNKYYNGSHRAVDTQVIGMLSKYEDSLFSLQCHVEQGPAAICRETKESEVRTIVKDAAHQLKPAAGGNNNNASWMSSLTLCGGFLGTPNTIMRKWDNLGDMGKTTAMQEYVSILDSIIPGWDDQPEYPVTHEDCFWKDDTGVNECCCCHAPFTLQNRRHHCRMCLDIFCHICTPHVVDMQLSRGAPVRPWRVCVACKAAIDNDQSLKEVRNLVKDNRDIKAQIQSIAEETDAQLNVKLAKAAALRADAIKRGCDMAALDSLIESKWTEPMGMQVKTPPAHKFRPTESVEACEQLRVANRQLVMCLKVAETRSKKALEKVDITIAVLEEAIRDRKIEWHPIAQLLVPYLTVVDLIRLTQTNRQLYTYIVQHDLEKRTCLRQSFDSTFRPQYWMWWACQNHDTHKYMCDLAEALTSKLGEYDSDEPLHWSSIMMKSSPVWAEAYALVLEKCGEVGTLEHDKQIVTDVNRTFGRSSLRKLTRRKSHEVGSEDEESKKEKLVHVLRAFTATQGNLGYCQGMNYVAACMLANVQWNEAQAFWLLTAVSVSPKYELMNMYRPGVPMLNLRFYQLHMLVKQYLPELHAHFEAEDFHVSMCASGWFMTLFTNGDTLPSDAVVRVMDCFLVYGWTFIFQVALALLQYLEVELLKVSFEEIVDIFYTLDDKSLILHPEYLVHAAHSIQVTDAMIASLQQEYEKEYPGALASSPHPDVDENQPRRVSIVSNSPESSPTNASLANKTRLGLMAILQPSAIDSADQRNDTSCKQS